MMIMEILQRVNKNQHNALYSSDVQIKISIKRDSIALATKHVTITAIFKYMPSNNSLNSFYSGTG